MSPEQLQELFSPGNIRFMIVALILGGIMLAGIGVDVFLLVYLRVRPLNMRRIKSRLRTRPWTWQEAGAIILALLALHGCVLVSMWALGNSGAYDERALTLFSLVIQSLLFPSVIILVVCWLVRVHGRSWGESLGLNRRTLGRDILLGGGLYLAAMPILAFYTLVYFKLLELLNFPIERQEIVRFLFDSDQPIWIRVHMLLAAALAAPVVEEIFFRGIALPAVARHARPMAAAAIVSLCFALMHFHVPSIMPLFIIAMAFSMGYLATGSLMVPMVMHAVFNTVSLTAMTLLKDMPDIPL